MKRSILGIFTAIIALAFTACLQPDLHVHDWGNWTETTAPTCTAAGVDTRTCATCGATETKAGAAALGHDWGDWIVTTPATETTEGVKTKTCKHDATHTETESIPVIVHTHAYAAAYTTDATQHWRECTAHDGAKTDEAAHTAGDWIIDTPATATTAGSQHQECTVCGYVTETETIPATGETHTHSYSTTWSYNATQHWHECSCGDKADVADHEWQWQETTPATTEAEGLETETCTTCGATNGTRPIDKLPAPITRQFPITVDGKTVTIKDMRTGANDIDLETLGVISRLQNGLDIQTTAALGIALERGLIIEVEETTEYTRFNAYSGNRLGARLSYVLSDDANFTLRLESVINSMMGMEPPPAHTHSYSTAWSTDATQHWHECSCGDKADVADHEWEWKVTTPATTEADGLETETCTTCGATRGTRPIDKLPEPPQFREATINNLFGEGYTATVQATLLEAEWDGVPAKIETAINDRYEYYQDAGANNFTGVYETIFARGVTIIVEKSPSGYTKWKTTADGKTIYLAYGELDNDLQTSVHEAVGKMRTNAEGSE